MPTTEKLRTLVIYWEDRFRKECRHHVGKIDSARIVLEVLGASEGFSNETWEEMASIDPHVLLVEFSKDPQSSLQLLKDLQQNFPGVPILTAGESFDSGFLIEALRLGVKEILSRPLTAEAVHQAFVRVQRQIGPSAQAKEPATIFSFFSCKGGNGSTTISTNFAVSLSKLSKKKVLVFDLDVEFGDVAGFFGLKSHKFLVQEDSKDSVLDPALIFRTITTHSKTGIDLLSFSDGFPQKSRALAAEVRPLLAILQMEYDYIIIDTSSTLNELVVSVLDSSHIIFLISKCSLPALRNAQRVLHGFERLGYSSSRIRLLLNRYLKGNDVSIKEVEKTLNFKVFWSIPNDYKSLIRSIQSGDPLTLQSDSIPLAKSFYDMSAHVLGIPIESHPRSGGGFLVRAKDTANKSLPLTTLKLLKS
ncbi:MAG: AAA family ATPase [Acidobacteria bacterium]|nr:AAA family ATPase [Acidobacteriota bacterium]MCI0718518.1 AAA family ATPase [Acidobacteriota bacterium]